MVQVPPSPLGDGECECGFEVSEAALLLVVEEYEEADKERIGEIWTILEQVRPSNTGELHNPGY